MSSILQSLIHNPIVRNHYLSDTHQTNLCPRQNCIHCTISTVFSSIYSSIVDPSTPFAPTDFITTVWKISTLFAGTDQQDSHEFLIFLLNAMHSHTFSGNGKGEERDERQCRCLVHQVFGGESQSSVRCEGCGQTNVTREMMFDIGLQIRGKAKIGGMNGKGVTNGNAVTAGGSMKGSPVSPSSSGGSSDVTTTEVSLTQSLQDCLDKFVLLR
jgi:ubiquitin carboxyl-terminal hydrolase 22/27/51